MLSTTEQPCLNMYRFSLWTIPRLVLARLDVREASIDTYILVSQGAVGGSREEQEFLAKLTAE